MIRVGTDWHAAFADAARWGAQFRPAAPPSPEPPAEALAARPLMEQVVAMADCIGAQTVGQITAISNRAAAWLRDNPPGQPVAIEPRGCPTPGACSCVEPATAAPAVVPVAVSERPILKSSPFNDAEGRCWCGAAAFSDNTGDLTVEHPPSWELRAPQLQDDCVAPHHAIPLPQVKEGES